MWLGLLSLAAVASAIGVWVFGRGLEWGRAGAAIGLVWNRLGGLGQVAVTGAAGGLLYLTAWLTWGNDVMSVSRRFGDSLPIALTALSAGLFYFSPSLLLGLVALAALLVLFYLRLDLGLAFIALVTPLYLQYRLLWQRGFALVEIFTLLVFIAWVVQRVRPFLTSLAARGGAQPLAKPWWRRLSISDWGVAAYLVVATLSLLTAELKGVALREYRLVMLEPVLFYLVMRTTKLDRGALWRIVDFLVAGAVYVALVGIYQYITKTDLITAEGGVARIRSVYGSPNNLALFLGRVLPLAVSTAVFGGHAVRRWLYGGAAVSSAHHPAHLFQGRPAAGRAGRFGCGRHRPLGPARLAGGGRLAGGEHRRAAPAGAVPRFADLLDFTSGTSFFRVQLWISAWRMWLDHPWLGVGPDNFLQMYRSRYILPRPGRSRTFRTRTISCSTS